jgi:hypothetical protein
MPHFCPLYRNIDLTVTSFQTYSEVAKFDDRLSKLVAELQSHPERCFAWSVYDLAKPRKSRTNMLKVFRLLPSLQSLIMIQTNDAEIYHMTPVIQDLNGWEDTFVTYLLSPSCTSVPPEWKLSTEKRLLCCCWALFTHPRQLTRSVNYILSFQFQKLRLLYHSDNERRRQIREHVHNDMPRLDVQINQREQKPVTTPCSALTKNRTGRSRSRSKSRVQV